MIKEVRLSREEKVKIMRVLRKRGLTVKERDLDAKNLAEAISMPVARNILRKYRGRKPGVKPTYREIKTEIQSYINSHKKYYAVSNTTTNITPSSGISGVTAIIIILTIMTMNALFYAYVLILALYQVIKYVFSYLRKAHTGDENSSNKSMVADTSDKAMNEIYREYAKEEGYSAEDMSLDTLEGEFTVEDADRTAKTDVDNKIFNEDDAKRTFHSNSYSSHFEKRLAENTRFVVKKLS